MKRIATSLITLLISGLILLIGSSATMAAPALADSQSPYQSEPTHQPSFDQKEFIYWFKQCEHMQGQEALAACEQALKINPHTAATWINHGQKLFDFGQYTQALSSFDTALLLKPDYSLGLANRCGILSVLGRYNEALDSCDMAILGDQQWGFSGQVLAWNNRGDTLIKMKRYEEALASFQKSLAIDPNDVAAQQYRHVVLEKLHHRKSTQHQFPDFIPPQKEPRIALVTR
ncbi:tetratricopeptide repeat protein [Acaryochloris sp. IP29b_bin.148]|uniref:tetratricopeptide repeat protein n=1 Tax=Acaryochloris sp. IP29b_bin.148 TaxID=2969218 RepID=UPI00262DFC4C|nr:tetratricopeptide repeat protein [Acaryochloris sp. IP29b_bin.148]